MKDFILFSILVYGFLLAGWVFKKRTPSLDHDGISKQISRFSLIFIESPSFLVVLWGMDTRVFTANFRLSLFPVALSLVLGAAGFLVSGIFRRGDIKYRGAFTLSAMVSNNGMTLGGFLCLLFLGETGLRLSQIYTLFLLPYMIFVLFPLARFLGRYGSKKKENTPKEKSLFLDTSILFPFFCLATGLTLTFTGIPFPPLLDMILPFLVMASVAGYSLSFGVGLRFSSFRNYWKACLAMVPIKFVLGPLAGIGLALLLGFTPEASPLAFRVIIVQASMPSAIISVVMAKIYNLDDHLSVNLWLFTTICTAAMFPLLKLIAGAW